MRLPFQTFVTALVTFTLATVIGQSHSSARQQTPSPSDKEIQAAAAAIEQSDGYEEILAATERYGSVISSPRVVELVDKLLESPSLNETQRTVLLLERQLSIDCRTVGASAAGRLLSIRLITVSAVSADTPQQFASVLEKFSPLARVITVELVRQALDTPGNAWPKPLLPLMEGLARDWPALGALGAATRMAEAANRVSTPAPNPSPSPSPNPGPTLIGHWRRTSIVFESPRDEHLVLSENGTAETWIVTASSRTPATRGRWNAKGTMLTISWEDGRQWGQPFTFFEGQLVFPNVTNQRQFWEVIR